MLEKIKFVMSSLWSFLYPFIKQLMSASGLILAQAALAAVKAVAANAGGSSDSAKRDLAFQMIVGDLKRQGIKIGVDIGTSMINTAIEVAVLKMKAA